MRCLVTRFGGATTPARHGLLGGLDVAAESLSVGLAPDAVGLRVLDARRVALDTDPERDAEVERLLVGEAELACELVDPDPCCQVVCQILSPAGGRYCSVSSILPRPAQAVRSASTAERSTSVRRARVKARVRPAASRQAAEPAHIHAPRPGRDRPSTRAPPGPATTRTSSSTGAVRRHPMHVRTGARPAPIPPLPWARPPPPAGARPRARLRRRPPPRASRAPPTTPPRSVPPRPRPAATPSRRRRW